MVLIVIAVVLLVIGLAAVAQANGITLPLLDQIGKLIESLGTGGK